MGHAKYYWPDVERERERLIALCLCASGLERRHVVGCYRNTNKKFFWIDTENIATHHHFTCNKCFNLHTHTHTQIYTQYHVCSKWIKLFVFQLIVAHFLFFFKEKKEQAIENWFHAVHLGLCFRAICISIVAYIFVSPFYL